MLKFIVFPVFAAAFLVPVVASGAWATASISEKVAACGAISLFGFGLFVACLMVELEESKEG